MAGLGPRFRFWGQTFGHILATLYKDIEKWFIYVVISSRLRILISGIWALTEIIIKGFQVVNMNVAIIKSRLDSTNRGERKGEATVPNVFDFYYQLKTYSNFWKCFKKHIPMLTLKWRRIDSIMIVYGHYLYCYSNLYRTNILFYISFTNKITVNLIFCVP